MTLKQKKWPIKNHNHVPDLHVSTGIDFLSFLLSSIDPILLGVFGVLYGLPSTDLIHPNN